MQSRIKNKALSEASQKKRTKLSKIVETGVETGGDSALALSNKRNATQPPTLPTFAPLRKKASSPSDNHSSSLTTSEPAAASDTSASRSADLSEQTPAQMKNLKRLARNKAARKARAEEHKLFNIDTGKPAPEGASQSKQNITLHAYACRHVPCNKRTRTTYVNAKTGELAEGITKETHQRGQHTTLYVWLERQKHKEFSKILEEGGDLPPAPLSNRYNKQKTSKIRTLYDIYTGKPAPKGAASSEQYITFNAYVKRYAKNSPTDRKTYVNAKTGVPAPGITKETHKRGQHTTLHTWLTGRKYAEFSNIIKNGGALPAALPRQKHKRQKAHAAYEQNTHRAPARSNIVLSRAEASKVSAGRHSSLTASGHAAVTIIETAKPLPLLEGLAAADLALNHSFLAPATPSTSPDTTPSAVTSVSTPILPPASHPLTSPLDMSLNSNPDEAFDASAHSISSPMISSTDQASPLPSPDLEEFLDDILLAESPFAAESDASVLASLTESDLTAKTATTAGEPLPLLSENPIQKPVERDLDLYFSEPVTTRPAFSSLPTTPLYAYSAEAADAVIRSELDPAISAEQDSFAQDTNRKRKPNVHSFFQPKENDPVGPASRKAKTMPSDGSAKHPFPAAATPDSTSAASFMPNPAAKRPDF